MSSLHASKISAESRKDVERQVARCIDNAATHFGEQWGAGACQDDFNGLLLSAKFHKELARFCLAFAAEHGLTTTTTQEDVDDSIEECLQLTRENEGGDSESEDSEDEESEDEDSEDEDSEDEDSEDEAEAAEAKYVPKHICIFCEDDDKYYSRANHIPQMSGEEALAWEAKMFLTFDMVLSAGRCVKRTKDGRWHSTLRGEEADYYATLRDWGVAKICPYYNPVRDAVLYRTGITGVDVRLHRLPPAADREHYAPWEMGKRFFKKSK